MPTGFSNVFCLLAAEGGAAATKYQIWNYCGHVKLRPSGGNAQFRGNPSKIAIFRKFHVFSKI
jgi:hypothetical protein